MHYTKPVKKTEVDIDSVQKEYAKTQPLLTHPYLSVRGISDTVQQSAKFQGVFRIDGYKNVVFPHFKNKAIVGFEKKNHSYTGFSSGGEKALTAISLIFAIFC
jgi:hypothetical protein